MLVTVEQLKVHMKSVPANQIMQVEIVEIDDGWCRIKMPYNETFTNSWKNTHGGALMTLADISGFLALATLIGLDKSGNIATLELKTNFLKANKDSDLFAEARVIKTGSQIFFCDIGISDPAGRIICHSTVTYIKAKTK